MSEPYAPSVRFYHLTRSPLETALPVMLERTLARQQRAVVILGSPERCAALDSLLWIWRDDSFLPHASAPDSGSAEAARAADQPIWLTCAVERPNGAEVLFFCDGMLPTPEQLSGVSLCAILFNGGDDQAVQQARRCWKQLRDAGLALSYWQQEERGWREVSNSNGGSGGD